MNAKAEKFKAYLEEKNITCFDVQEGSDELHTVVFRSVIEAEGQQLPTLIITDDSIFGIVRVRVANSVLKENNETALIKALNELNRTYKVFKYYIGVDGALMLDCCVLDRPGEIDGDMIYTILDLTIKHLEAEYKNIMKTVWA